MIKLTDFKNFCLEHSDEWILIEYSKLVRCYYDNNISIGPLVPKLTSILKKILIDKKLI